MTLNFDLDGRAPEEAENGRASIPCDLCGRVFERDWLVGASGSTVECLHCYFGAISVDPDLAGPHNGREWVEQGRELKTKAERIAMGGAVAFLRHGLAQHDERRCSWGGKDGCVLCAGKAVGLQPDDERALIDWVEMAYPRQGNGTSQLPNLGAWNELESAAQHLLATALADLLGDGTVIVERPNRTPWLRDAVGAEWVLCVTKKDARLVGRQLATRGWIGHLLGEGTTEPAAPWVGFDRHLLPRIIARGFELASAPSKSVDTARLPQGLEQIIAMGADWIEVIDGSRRRIRLAASHLEARDALGRLEPSPVPPTVGIRLSRRLNG